MKETFALGSDFGLMKVASKTVSAGPDIEEAVAPERTNDPLI